MNDVTQTPAATLTPAPAATPVLPASTEGAAGASSSIAPARAPALDAAPSDAAASSAPGPQPEPAPSVVADAATPAPATPEFPATALDAGRKPAADPAPATPEPAKPADAAKPDGEKPDGEVAPAPAPDGATAPIEYAFTFPDDVKADAVNPERMDSLKGILNEAHVPPEHAQKLLDLHLSEVRELSKGIAERLTTQQWDVFRQQTNAMHDEIKADPVLGGARYDTAMRTIGTVIEQYLPVERQKQLYDRLRATGMGNDVNLALLLHTFGEMIGREARSVPAQEPRRIPMTRQQRGEARYASTPSSR